MLAHAGLGLPLAISVLRLRRFLEVVYRYSSLSSFPMPPGAGEAGVHAEHASLWD